MHQIVFNVSDVLSKLSGLKLNKSPGPDMLHPRVLHEIRDEIVTPLNLSF